MSNKFLETRQVQDFRNKDLEKRKQQDIPNSDLPIEFSETRDIDIEIQELRGQDRVLILVSKKVGGIAEQAEQVANPNINMHNGKNHI